MRRRAVCHAARACCGRLGVALALPLISMQRRATLAVVLSGGHSSGTSAGAVIDDANRETWTESEHDAISAAGTPAVFEDILSHKGRSVLQGFRGQSLAQTTVYLHFCSVYKFQILAITLVAKAPSQSFDWGGGRMHKCIGLGTQTHLPPKFSFSSDFGHYILKMFSWHWPLSLYSCMFE